MQLEERTMILLLVVVTLGGLSVGWPLLRRHLRKRQRQRHFVKFLRQWRAKLEVPSSRGDLALESERLYYHYQQDQVLMAYRRHCPAFNAKVERVSDCFADPLRFRALAFV